MPDRAAAKAFMQEYRQTFESFDVPSIAALFAFPLTVVGDGPDGSATVQVIESPDHWLSPLARVLGGYRLLGVTRAHPVSTAITPVSPAIAQATVTWSLRTAEDAEVYSFTASYTLADLPEGTRVVAIAHDESPRLAAAIGRARGGLA